MKLSELAAQTGIPIETLMAELEIDGAGKFSDISASAGRVGELETVLQQRQTELAAYAQYYQQMEQQKNQLASAQGGLTQAQASWYEDEVFRPIAQSFQALQGEVRDIQEKKIAALEQRLNHGWSQVAERFDRMDRQELKSRYDDFDEDRVRRFANERGLTKWEDAYLMEKSSRLPDIIKDSVAKARLDQESATRRDIATGATEIGGRSSSRTAPPDKSLSYEGAWDKLGDTLSEAGF